MKRAPKFTLYFKLFLVFGITFLGLVQMISDSMIPPYAEENYATIIIQLFLCVLLVIANVFAVRYILQPLSKLTQFSRELSEGNFAPRLRLDTNDEIGELASAMNNMAERLQSQLESLKHIAVGVSHEIRSPLTRMRLAAEMLPEGEGKQILTSQIHEMDSITGAILDREALNSGISELQKQPLDLDDLLLELSVHYEAGGNTIKISGGPLIISADRRRLEMCLKNLLDNAMKYGDGSASVTYRIDDGTAEIAVVNSSVNGKPAKGFGLGLLLSESIANAHGGSLRFHSKDNKVLVVLRLPV